MNLSEKAQKTVQKLLKLTRDNQISWDRSKEIHEVIGGSNDRVDAFYTTKQGDVRFRVYEASYQASDDGETFYWASEPRVEIVDFDGAVIWRLPKTSEMWDLLETVKVKAGNVEQSLDQFLSDEE